MSIYQRYKYLCKSVSSAFKTVPCYNDYFFTTLWTELPFSVFNVTKYTPLFQFPVEILPASTMMVWWMKRPSALVTNTWVTSLLSIYSLSLVGFG